MYRGGGGYKFFNSGQFPFEDDERLGHPFPSTGGRRIDKIGTLLRENRCLSNRELVETCEKATRVNQTYYINPLTRLRAAVRRKGKKCERMVTNGGFWIKV